MSMADLAKELEKAIGLNSNKQQVQYYLDTGYPPLNKIISGKYDGGIACGRITEMFGPSSSGKTAIAMKLMIEAQKAGGVAMFMDHERSFDLGMAKLSQSGFINSLVLGKKVTKLRLWLPRLFERLKRYRQKRQS